VERLRSAKDANGESQLASPFGQETSVTLNTFGYANTISNPADEAYAFDYFLDTGLMGSSTDPRGGVKEYEFDEMGRLTAAHDEGDGTQTFRRFNTYPGMGYTVRRTTSEGGESDYTTKRWYSTGERRIRRMPNGEAVETTSDPAQGTSRTLMPSDMVLRTERQPDPRFGMQAGYTGSSESRMPSGLVSETTTARSASFTTAGDLSTLESLTSTTTVNGRTFETTYDQATKTFTSTSAESREATVEVDALGRTTRSCRPSSSRWRSRTGRPESSSR
jgi:YD repeat-containing protein